MASRDTKIRYEALLIAVREALDELDDYVHDNEPAAKARAVLMNALEEIGEPRRDDSWAV